MPYMIRSKGLILNVRDGRAASSPMRVLRPLQWVRFDCLPLGLNPLGDHQLEVRELMNDPDAPQKEVTEEEVHERKRKRRSE